MVLQSTSLGVLAKRVLQFDDVVFFVVLQPTSLGVLAKRVLQFDDVFLWLNVAVYRFK